MGKDIANSNYNGLVTTAKYQGRHGIFLQASYTFSKSLDNSSSWSVPSDQRGGVANPRNLSLEYGPSNFDLRNRAVFTDVIDLPMGPGHRFLGWNNLVNREFMGGWQISGITTIQGGAPFTVYNASADFSGFNQFFDGPDVIGSGQLRRTIGIRMRRSTQSSSPRLRRPGVWERRDAINTTGRAWSISIFRR